MEVVRQIRSLTYCNKKYWFAYNVYRHARTNLNGSGCVPNLRNHSRTILVRCRPFYIGRI